MRRLRSEVNSRNPGDWWVSVGGGEMRGWIGAGRGLTRVGSWARCGRVGF